MKKYWNENARLKAHEVVCQITNIYLKCRCYAIYVKTGMGGIECKYQIRVSAAYKILINHVLHFTSKFWNF